MRTKTIITALLAGMLIVPLVSVNKAVAGGGRLSLGAEVGMPMGDFADQASVGYGLSARYELPLGGDHLALMLTAGWITWPGKTINSGFGDYKISTSIIPVQAGAKFYLSEQQKGLYFSGEIGIHALSFSTDLTGATDPDGTTALSYAPGVGFHLSNLDLGLRYQLFSESQDSYDASGNAISETVTNSYLGLRIAYAFGGE